MTNFVDDSRSDWCRFEEICNISQEDGVAHTNFSASLSLSPNDCLGVTSIWISVSLTNTVRRYLSASRDWWIISGDPTESFAIKEVVVGPREFRPIISSSSKYSPNFVKRHLVTITNGVENSSIYYTLDGSLPSTSSSRYNGPIQIEDSVVVRAIAVSNGYTSPVVEHLFRKWDEQVDLPSLHYEYVPYSPDDLGHYEVRADCSTDDAKICYTLDGRTPTELDPVLPSALKIDKSCTIKIAAFRDGFWPSDVVSQNVTNAVVALAEYLDAPNLDVHCNGWGVSYDDYVGTLPYSMTSCSSNSTLTVNFNGHGAFVFWCKANDNSMVFLKFDSPYLYIPGTESNSETGFIVRGGNVWKRFCYYFSEGGPHRATFMLSRNSESFTAFPPGSSASSSNVQAWVDHISFEPSLYSALFIDDPVLTGPIGSSWLIAQSCGAEFIECTETNGGVSCVRSFRPVSMTWKVEKGEDLATVSDSGIICTGDQEGEVSVSVSYRAQDLTKTTNFLVRIVRGIEGLSIEGADHAPLGGSRQYVCHVDYTDGTRAVVPAEWSLVQGEGLAVIDRNSGLLKAGSSKEGGVQVCAKVVYYGREYVVKKGVSIAQKAVEQLAVEGARSFTSGSCEQLAAYAIYDDGSVRDVTSLCKWSILEGDEFAYVTRSGELNSWSISASLLKNSTNVIVRAEWTDKQVTYFGDYTVRLEENESVRSLRLKGLELSTGGSKRLDGCDSHWGVVTQFVDVVNSPLGDTQLLPTQILPFILRSSEVDCGGPMTNWLQVTIKQPARLSFRMGSFATDTNTEKSDFSLWVDGVVVTNMTGDNGHWLSAIKTWQSYELEFTGGVHQVRWLFARSTDFYPASGAVADLNLTLLPPPPPPKHILSRIEIDGPSTLRSGSSAAYRCLAYYEDGEVSQVVPNVRFANGNAWFSRCAPLGGFDPQTCVLTVCPQVFGTMELETGYGELCEGKSISLRTSKIIVVPPDFNEIPLQEALDSTNLVFEGDSWIGQDAVSYDGIDAVRNRCVSGTHVLQTTVTRPGRIGFSWKSSLPPGNLSYPLTSYVAFRVLNESGECIKEIKKGNMPSWEYCQTDIKSSTASSNNVFTLQWVYYRAEAVTNSSENACWIDEVAWSPAKLSYIGISSANTVLEGDTVQCRSWAEFDGGSNMYITPQWRILEGSEFAAISSEGILSAIKSGNVVIEASYELDGDVKTRTKTISICKRPAELYIFGTNTVVLGESECFASCLQYVDGSIKFAEAYWSIQGKSVAKGEVWSWTPSQEGMFEISAQYSENGLAKTTKLIVSVKKELRGMVVLGRTSAVVGAAVELNGLAIYSDGSTNDVTSLIQWEEIKGGTMSKDGVFTPNKIGTAEIVGVYEENGIEARAKFELEVRAPLVGVTIVGPSAVDADKVSTFICQAHYGDGSIKVVTPVWHVSGGDASMSNNGNLVATSTGVLTLGANYSEEGVSFSAEKSVLVSRFIALTVGAVADLEGVDKGSVTSVVVKASVGRIPFRMFDSYTNLQHVVVESGVTEIGEAAFTQCRALREIKLGEGIENIKRLAFLNCESLREITIPNSVTNIGDFVWGWSGLTNVVVGSGVKRIDEKAFVGCSKLRNITFLGNAPVGGPNVLDGTPRSLTNWVYRASTGWSTEWPVGDVDARPVAIIDPAVVNGVLTVGSVSDMNYVDRASVTSVVVKASIGRIPESMFHSYSNLLHVVIEPGVTGIGSSAFSQCKALEDIVLGEGILTMDRLSFLNCESLREITIPNSVTNIGEYSFGWAPKLTNVVVGCGVKNIDRGAFADCHNLSRITFLGNAPTSGSEVFKGTPQGLTNWIYSTSTGWASEWPVGDVYARPVAIIDPAVVNGVLTVGSVSDTNYVDRASVTSVVVKAGLSIVPPEMFRGWPELLSVVIEEGVREIRYAAFGHCPKLRTAEIAQSVTNVEACVFQFCGQLRRADLPSGVDKIENCTFSNCTNLESTVIPDSVKWIGDYAYIECEALRKVFIGSGVTNLGEFAFNNCVNLEVATIGGRVKNLANDVFSGCRRLRDVFFEGNAPTASSNVFAGTPHGLTNWVHQSAVGWLAQWPSNDTNARPVSYVDVVKRTYGVGETLWVSDFSTWGATSTNDVLTMNAGSTIRVRPGATNSSRGWRIPLALKGGEVVLDLSLYDDETPFWIARSVYSEDGSWLRVKNSRNKRIRLGSPSPMNYDIDFWGSPQLRSDGGFGTVISDGALVFEDCPTVEVWHGIGLYHDLEGCAVVYLKDGTNASTCYPVVLAMGTDFYRGQKSIDLLDHVLVLMAQDVAGAGQCLHIGANINLYSSPVATFRVSATDVYLATAGNPVVKADIALAGGNIYAAQASHEFTGALSGQGTISISGWGGSAILRNSAASTVDLGVVCSQRGTRLRISNSSLFRGSISTFSSSTESQAGTYGGSKFGGAQQSYALNYIDAISTDGADSVFAVEQYQLRTVATPTNGAAIKVYSGQTFSIGTLSGTGVHVLDSAGRAGNLVIGTASTSQNWYLPTNVNVTVSNFNPTATGQSIVFDTSHGNNQTVFAIKNANATARTWRMKAISPRMLPRRIEGFTGDLVLGPLPQGDKQTTVTENNWVFPFNSDLADPNVNGCAGSGTLSVPPTGSIRLVFSGTKPLRGGTYPLLTATSGGNALSASAWPVTVEGSVPTGYEIVRDATGISLRIPTVAAEEVVYEDAEGQMFSVSVPHAWLESYPTILSSFDGDFAAAARGRSPGQTGKGKSWDNGKPMYMWQDYLAGTDPLDTNSVFRARIDMVNGVPCLSWTPDLKSTRSYIIYGTPSLVPSSWHSPTNANDRFFKVGVEVK